MTKHAFNEKTIYIVGPSYTEARRRRIVHTLLATACVPAVFILFGVVKGGFDAVSGILPVMLVLLAGIVAVSVWHAGGSADDRVEQVELGEHTLVLRGHFSECELHYQSIWAVTVYYQEIRTRHGYYHSHKRMELAINGISGGVGPYRLMERLAEDIRDRAQAVNGGIRIGDKAADREQRLAQRRQCLSFYRLLFGLLLIVGIVLGVVSWHLAGKSEQAWDQASRAKGVVTDFSEDVMWLTVKYVFTDAGGIERAVSSSTSNGELRPHLTPGSSVTVKYFPDRPLAATIEMEGFDRMPRWIWVGVIFLGACVLVCAMALTGYEVAVVEGRLVFVGAQALPEDYIRL